VEVCLVKLEEGKIAQQQGNLKGVKDHGSAMVASQNQMLTDLKKIATNKSVITSADMPDNFYALEDLRQLHGESFDKKFVKKMLYNYKRSVRDFERATRSQDADIQVFATKYLPVVKAQYAEIKSLKKKL
jgi:predicted outer membrane protein